MTARIEIEGNESVTEVVYHKIGEAVSQSACFTDPVVGMVFRKSLLGDEKVDLVSISTLGSHDAETLYRNPETGAWSDKDERLPF